MSKDPSQSFKIGDLAVYPAHGVGEIIGIERREVSGTHNPFYILKVFDTEATIMVPVDNAFSVGLRKGKEGEVENETWNRRYRDYTDKIKSGCVMELAKVLRDLYILKFDKELSFGERKMFDTAKNLLVKELSIARKIKVEKIEEELYRIPRK